MDFNRASYEQPSNRCGRFRSASGRRRNPYASTLRTVAQGDPGWLAAAGASLAVQPRIRTPTEGVAQYGFIRHRSVGDGRLPHRHAGTTSRHRSGFEAKAGVKASIRPANLAPSRRYRAHFTLGATSPQSGLALRERRPTKAVCSGTGRRACVSARSVGALPSTRRPRRVCTRHDGIEQDLAPSCAARTSGRASRRQVRSSSDHHHADRAGVGRADRPGVARCGRHRLARKSRLRWSARGARSGGSRHSRHRARSQRPLVPRPA